MRANLGLPLRTITVVDVSGSWHSDTGEHDGLSELRFRIRDGRQPGHPMVVPGLMCVRELPPGVTTEEARRVEALALDILCGFFDLARDEEARAHLTFSPDGQTATYHLDIYHYHAPLAASGRIRFVSLKRCGKQWVVTGAQASGWWWS
jgi:hypothetical protein